MSLVLTHRPAFPSDNAPPHCPCLYLTLISTTSASFAEKPTVVTVELSVNTLGPVSILDMVSTDF